MYQDIKRWVSLRVSSNKELIWKVPPFILNSKSEFKLASKLMELSTWMMGWKPNGMSLIAQL
jgi:hypothetical protein